MTAKLVSNKLTNKTNHFKAKPIVYNKALMKKRVCLAGQQKLDRIVTPKMLHV